MVNKKRKFHDAPYSTQNPLQTGRLQNGKLQSPYRHNFSTIHVPGDTNSNAASFSSPITRQNRCESTNVSTPEVERTPSSKLKNKRKRRKNNHKDHQNSPVSSPFLPDAISTPTPNNKNRNSTTPVRVPVPVDPRLSASYINAQASKIRRQVYENIKEQSFSSHAISSTSSSGSDSDETDSSDEESETSTDHGSRASVASLTHGSTPGNNDGTTEASPARQSALKGSSRKALNGQATHTSQAKKEREVKDGGDSSRSLPSTICPKVLSVMLILTKAKDRTKALLLSSLNDLIPEQFKTQACNQLQRSMEAKVKNNHSKKTYLELGRANTDINTEPDEELIILRAARQMIVHLSSHILGEPNENKTGDIIMRASHRTKRMCLENDLTRIANERGSRIKCLELKNKMMRNQLRSLLGNASAVDESDTDSREQAFLWL